MNNFYASDILVRQHHARLRADADHQRLVRAARRTRTRRGNGVLASLRRTDLG